MGHILGTTYIFSEVHQMEDDYYVVCPSSSKVVLHVDPTLECAIVLVSDTYPFMNSYFLKYGIGFISTNLKSGS